MKKKRNFLAIISFIFGVFAICGLSLFSILDHKKESQKVEAVSYLPLYSYSDDSYSNIRFNCAGLGYYDGQTGIYTNKGQCYYWYKVGYELSRVYSENVSSYRLSVKISYYFALHPFSNSVTYYGYAGDYPYGSNRRNTFGESFEQNIIYDFNTDVVSPISLEISMLDKYILLGSPYYDGFGGNYNLSLQFGSSSNQLVYNYNCLSLGPSSYQRYVVWYNSNETFYDTGDYLSNDNKELTDGLTTLTDSGSNTNGAFTTSFEYTLSSRTFSIDLPDSYEDGFNQGYNDGYNDGQANGYNSGSLSGYNNGYSVGYNQALEESQQSIQNAYQNGYSTGLLEGQSQDTTVATIFSGILQVAMVPVNFFLAIFNFEILGINLSAFIRAIFTVVLTIIVLKTVLGKGGGSSDN